MKTPHRARRLALQALCCLDVQGSDGIKGAESFLADSHESDATLGAAREFLRSTWNRRDEIDAILARHARHWDLARLAMVDRNILRLSVCELQSKPTAGKVVISEALMLAEEFSTAESPRFVNGILDAVYKDFRNATE